MKDHEMIVLQSDIIFLQKKISELEKTNKALVKLWVDKIKPVVDEFECRKMYDGGDMYS